MTKILKLEDCRETISSGIEYDYVFTSPPDYDEFGLSPDDTETYSNKLKELFVLFKPKTNLITVSFTDRKYNGGIISKSSHLTYMMEELGYRLLTHKIYVKSLKVNLYRLNYSNVLTFGKGKTKQYMSKSFKPDVWIDGMEKYKGYNYGMSVAVPEKCILNYTKEGDVVYDPFMGSGTTAVAAAKTNRGYLGSEIFKEYYDLSVERLASFNADVDDFIQY